MAGKNGDAEGIEELADSEQLNTERLRRMKALIRQIHREEYEAKKFHLPPIKGKSVILFLSFASLILFGVTALYNFNLLVTLEEKVMATRGHLEYALQRRANLFDNLVNLAINQADLEREVFQHTDNGRAKLNRPPMPEELPTMPDVGPQGGDPLKPGSGGGVDSRALTMLSDPSLSRLLAIVEQYPNVKVAETYQKLMEKMVEIEDRIAQRADEHNEQVRVFNTMITSYPWYILAKLTGFERYDYFRSQEEYSRHPRLSADTFRQILPSARGEPVGRREKERMVQSIVPDVSSPVVAPPIPATVPTANVAPRSDLSLAITPVLPQTPGLEAPRAAAPSSSPPLSELPVAPAETAATPATPTVTPVASATNGSSTPPATAPLAKPTKGGKNKP